MINPYLIQAIKCDLLYFMRMFRGWFRRPVPQLEQKPFERKKSINPHLLTLTVGKYRSPIPHGGKGYAAEISFKGESLVISNTLFRTHSAAWQHGTDVLEMARGVYDAWLEENMITITEEPVK